MVERADDKIYQILFSGENPLKRVHYFETTRLTEKLTGIPEEGARGRLIC